MQVFVLVICTIAIGHRRASEIVGLIILLLLPVAFRIILSKIRWSILLRVLQTVPCTRLVLAWIWQLPCRFFNLWGPRSPGHTSHPPFILSCIILATSTTFSIFLILRRLAVLVLLLLQLRIGCPVPLPTNGAALLQLLLELPNIIELALNLSLECLDLIQWLRVAHTGIVDLTIPSTLLTPPGAPLRIIHLIWLLYHLKVLILHGIVLVVALGWLRFFGVHEVDELVAGVLSGRSCGVEVLHFVGGDCSGLGGVSAAVGFWEVLLLALIDLVTVLEYHAHVVLEVHFLCSVWLIYYKLIHLAKMMMILCEIDCTIAIVTQTRHLILYWKCHIWRHLGSLRWRWHGFWVEWVTDW